MEQLQKKEANSYVMRPVRMKPTVTFDSTTKPDDLLVHQASAAGWHVAHVSVSKREWPSIGYEISLEQHELLPELAIWDESPWDDARWAGEHSDERLEALLAIISNGSFPKDRNQLTEGQHHQLRDAMILEAHSAAGRDLFVTEDSKGFIGHGRREHLQELLQIRILSPSEFRDELEMLKKIEQ